MTAYNDYATLPSTYVESIAFSRALEQARKTFGFPASLPESATLSAALAEVIVAGAPQQITVFNVVAYGAKGDGTTDDHIAIQAAIAAAQANGGGRVYFPHSTLGYNIGTTTLLVTANNVLLQAADANTYLKYSGSGYAISFALAGAAQMHNCGTMLLGVVGTAIGSSGLYIKSPYGFFMDQGYFENVTTSNTAVGVTIDGGLTSGGTGYFATHNLINHIRCNGFLKGILFKGGSLSGWDITTASVVSDCFVNSLVGLTGSIGIEFQGAQQCTVRSGNYESLDYGVKFTSTPSRCIGVALDGVRFESIAVNNWLIPADSEDTSIVAAKYAVDNGSNLAADTTVVQTVGTLTSTVRRNKKTIALANGLNQNVARGIGTGLSTAGFLRITGPSASFSIDSFSLESAGFAATDGAELIVFNSTAQQMTLVYGAGPANNGIRTPAQADVVVPAKSGGTTARFIFDAAYPQWVLVSVQS